MSHDPRKRVPFRAALLPLLLAAAFDPAFAQVAPTALPSGGRVVAGQAAFSQTGAALTIQQTTPKLVANWQSFNIGTGASVVFAQPNAQSVALNRVTAGDATQILGSLRANGQVFLLNPQGVVFGNSARVDVGGLVASSMALSDADFLNGSYRFTAGPGAGAVNNAGTLQGGYVVLLAPSVANTGTIQAPAGGQVALAAGQGARLALDAGGLIGVQVDPSAVANIANSGALIADGGRVYLTANQSSQAVAGAINQTGLVRANTLAERNGEIWIDGGRGAVQLAGTVQAQGAAAATSGGRIVATGGSVQVDGRLDASGPAGGGTVLVGGGAQGKDASVANAATVALGSASELRADATASGQGGNIVVWSDRSTQLGGLLSARGVSRGGFVETSSAGDLRFGGSIDIAASQGAAGRWLIDPTFTVIDIPAAAMISGLLDAGGTTDIQSTTSITVAADINKTRNPTLDAALNFRAGTDILVASGKAISSTAGRLDVNFCGTTCSPSEASNGTGTATVAGQLATNGGAVHFYKAATLSSTSPISTKLLGVSSGASGDVTFEKDVTLNAASLAVNISTQGAQSGSTYVGTGGNVDFKGRVVSGVVSGVDQLVPIALSVDTTGTTAGAITLRNSVGTQAAPLAKLTLAGPATIALEASEINLRAASGDVLVATSTKAPATGPTIVLGAPTTDIRVTGGIVNGVAGYADYKQDTFNLGVKDATPRTLNITADRSIRIANRSIDGETNGGTAALEVNLKPYAAAAATGTLAAGGGAILLDNAEIRSNGGAIHLGGAAATDFAVGYGRDIAGITDGIRIFNSRLISGNGPITLRGKAPTESSDGGAGVRIYGLTTLNSGTGGVLVDGRVERISTSGNKDAVVIGEGSTSVTSLIATGSAPITINGDASSIGIASAGSRYDGVLVTQGALIQTASGDIAITGKGGGGNTNVSDRNNGVELDGNNTRILATAGNITFTGVSGGRAGSYGLYSRPANITVGRATGGSASGIISLLADTMQFVNSSTTRMQVAGTGELRIRPLSAGQAIDLGTSGVTDRLGLGATWFSGSNSVFQPGFADIAIGRAGAAGAVVPATGALTVSAGTTVTDPLNLEMTGSGGKIQVNAPLTVTGPAGEARTLALKANAGVGSTTAGVVTVDKLQLIGRGDFVLQAANQVNTLAGTSPDGTAATGIDGAVIVNNGRALNVGTVASTSYGVTTANAVGVKTTGKDVSLGTSAGNLTLAQNVDAGSGGVLLAATAGAVNETAAAVVSAGRLAVKAQDTSSLANANRVSTLAGATTGAGADLTFVSDSSIKVESSANVTGLNVAGTAWLQANNGGITQSDAVTARSTALTASGPIVLDLRSGANAVNDVGTVAAVSAAGVVNVASRAAVTVGTAATTAGGTLTGINADSGQRTVRVASDSGDITLAANVNAGAVPGSVVSLAAANGSVNETGTASITAGQLMVKASGTSVLANANTVPVLAASITGAARDLTFVGKGAVELGAVTDVSGASLAGLSVPGSAWVEARGGNLTQTRGVAAGSLAAKASGSVALDLPGNTIGTLAAVAGAGTVLVETAAATSVGSVGTAAANASLGGPLSGVATAGKDITLRNTAGGLRLAGPVTANGAVASLESAGAITQSSGAITAAQLRVLAGGNADLLSAGNKVDVVAAKVSGGSFAYRDGDALKVGTVTVSLGRGAGTTTGTSTGNGEQYLRAGGAIELAANLDAGSGVASIDAAGAITQTAGAATAGHLRLAAQGSVDVQQAGNMIGTVAGTAAGSFSVRSASALTVGSVTGTLGGGTPTTSGVSTATSDGNIALRSGGLLTLAQSVAAGAGRVTLDGRGGVNQSGGALTASQLDVQSGGDATLAQPGNNVGTLAARSAGSFTYYDTDSLTVGSVGATAGVQSAGATSIRTGRDLQLDAPVVSTAAMPHAVVLAATRNFQNNAGRTGVLTPNGTWLIYDDNTTYDPSRLGGLPIDFLRRPATYDQLPPSAVEPPGNGYVTTMSPPVPEQLARLSSGPTLPVTSAASGTSASLQSGNPELVSEPVAKAGPGRLLQDGLLSIELTGGQRFEADLRLYAGGGEIESVQLADGQALPRWLGFDAVAKRFYGLVPAPVPGAFRVRMVVRQGDARRVVEVEFTPALMRS